ncbi:hypothetical protein HYW36_00950 [Candidatus Saccharibacteria bacterium]|nr:hypothetical protein [Candidatus Saccharibacteria bacterium]
MKFSEQNFTFLAWTVTATVAVLAILAWGQGIGWQLGSLSTYGIFPLLGLLAFSLMWSMYAVGFGRRRWQVGNLGLSQYYKVIPLVILAAILLHPGLLVWQLWRDGFGLPPESYWQHYVVPAARWAVLISSTAWLVFIAYELRYRYRQKSWWKYMETLADLALIGIYFHALRLGSQLQHGWFRYVWYFYGLSLAVFLIDSYRRKITV